MDILPCLVVLLPPANDELVFLNGYIELVAGESGDRQRDPQTLGLALRPVAPLDIVGRVTVGAFDDPIEHALDLVEAQKEGTGKHGNTRHSLQSPLEATLVHQGPYRHPLISNMGISACGFKDVAGGCGLVADPLCHAERLTCRHGAKRLRQARHDEIAARFFSTKTNPLLLCMGLFSRFCSTAPRTGSGLDPRPAVAAEQMQLLPHCCDADLLADRRRL